MSHVDKLYVSSQRFIIFAYWLDKVTLADYDIAISYGCDGAFVVMWSGVCFVDVEKYLWLSVKNGYWVSLIKKEILRSNILTINLQANEIFCWCSWCDYCSILSKYYKLCDEKIVGEEFTYKN